MRTVLVVIAWLLLLAGCETYATPIAPQLPTIDPGVPTLPTRTPLPPTVPPATSVPAPTPQLTAEPATQYYQAGMKAFGQGRYADALLNFTQALRVDPKNALLYLNRAQVYLAQQDYDSAIGDFTQVINLDPKNVVAWVSRGQARAASQDFENAISDLDQAIKLSPVGVRESRTDPASLGGYYPSSRQLCPGPRGRSQLRAGVLPACAGLCRRSARAATGRRSPRGG
jgi:cytochrome c-type biogenesis protein CcmH/NrfG